MKRLMERRREEQGFTLIELMVVVLIIGILVAIALPTFLGARERSQDKAAASDLRNGIAAAKVWFSDDDTYTGFDTVAAEDIEPNIDWVAAGDPAVGEVAIVVAGPALNTRDVLLVRESDSGKFFCVAEDDAGGTSLHYGANYAAVDTVAECLAATPI